MKRIRLSIAAMMGLILLASVGLGALRYASVMWAGFVLLLTLGVLTSAILGVVYRGGTVRAFWLGFALFGWGYMALIADQWWDVEAMRPPLLTSHLLDRAYPFLRASPGPSVPSSLFLNLFGMNEAQDRRIFAALEKPISIPFPKDTPFEDVLRHIRAATSSAEWPSGIPIYVDPGGLVEANVTMASPVSLELDGVELGRSMRLILKQLNLTFEVKDGMLMISNQTRAFSPGTDAPESFRRIGHYLFALLAACVGGLIGRSFQASESRRELVSS